MRFRPLHPDLGVEVLDFDVQHGGTPAEVAELRQAYLDHSLLLFRGGGRIAPARQVEVATWFGPPGPVDNSGDGDFVSVLQNGEDAGARQLPFHSDLTYTDCPIKAICLHAVAVPEGGTSTTFVSGRAAWKKLPDDLQDALADKTALHVFVAKGAYGWPDFEAEHPVRLIHPRSGEPVLFVTEHHAERILELDPARSGDVLAKLFATLYAEEARYEHWWRQDDW